MKLHRLLGAVGLAGACSLSSACVATETAQDAPAYVPDVTVTRAPFDHVYANWKQRLDQPYVYVEHVGDYRFAGTRIAEVHDALAARGGAASGPPFILFYDDPARVELESLRARVCLPVANAISPGGELSYDVLPSTTVVYAVVGGPYPEVPRAYPGLYDYLGKMHWVENGPIREIYLVRPDGNGNVDELLCEVQIPATQGR